MKTTMIFTHSARKILAATLVFLSGALTDFSATVESSRARPREKAPTGLCNLPPVPTPGQTVTWTLAGSPYEICQNITIPATSTVIVEAGVQINFDADMQVLVSGTMDLQSRQTGVAAASQFTRCGECRGALISLLPQQHGGTRRGGQALPGLQRNRSVKFVDVHSQIKPKSFTHPKFDP